MVVARPAVGDREDPNQRRVADWQFVGSARRRPGGRLGGRGPNTPRDRDGAHGQEGRTARGRSRSPRPARDRLRPQSLRPRSAPAPVGADRRFRSLHDSVARRHAGPSRPPVRLAWPTHRCSVRHLGQGHVQPDDQTPGSSQCHPRSPVGPAVIGSACLPTVKRVHTTPHLPNRTRHSPPSTMNLDSDTGGRRRASVVECGSPLPLSDAWGRIESRQRTAAPQTLAGRLRLMTGQGEDERTDRLLPLLLGLWQRFPPQCFRPTHQLDHPSMPDRCRTRKRAAIRHHGLCRYHLRCKGPQTRFVTPVTGRWHRSIPAAKPAGLLCFIRLNATDLALAQLSSAQLSS